MIIFLSKNIIYKDIGNIYVNTFVIFRKIGSWKTERKYSGHYILDFPLFWFLNTADYYSPMKDKYRTLHVILFCFLQHFNPLIQMRKGWKN